jgi:hypothetical protein
VLEATFEDGTDFPMLFVQLPGGETGFGFDGSRDGAMRGADEISEHLAFSAEGDGWIGVDGWREYHPSLPHWFAERTNIIRAARPFKIRFVSVERLLMSSHGRSLTFGVVVFVILVVGAYIAVRELASAELQKVTSTPPSISFPTAPFSVAPPTGLTLWNCPSSSTSVPSSTPSAPQYAFCTHP